MSRTRKTTPPRVGVLLTVADGKPLEYAIHHPACRHYDPDEDFRGRDHEYPKWDCELGRPGGRCRGWTSDQLDARSCSCCRPFDRRRPRRNLERSSLAAVRKAVNADPQFNPAIPATGNYRVRDGEELDPNGYLYATRADHDDEWGERERIISNLKLDPMPGELVEHDDGTITYRLD